MDPEARNANGDRRSKPSRESFVRRLAVLVATWGGIGRVPIAPGTAGTLAAVPLFPVLAHVRAAAPVLQAFLRFAIAHLPVFGYLSGRIGPIPTTASGREWDAEFRERLEAQAPRCSRAAAAISRLRRTFSTIDARHSGGACSTRWSRRRLARARCARSPVACQRWKRER